MPSKYKRVLGGRRYQNYTPETLARALEPVKNGEQSQRKASDTYGIPVGTIKNKLKNSHRKKQGGQPVFTKAEEEAFTKHICTLSLYGFPLDQADLKSLVKSYLDCEGRTLKQFKDNVPGKDWIKLFLRRNPTLTQRFASNIKRSRAEITVETLSEYFEHLKSEIENIPANCLGNYDETNLSDDPGKKKIFTKRGTKYPERVMNSSKSSTSIIFCGNAAGDMLPPYVVYKSDKLWSSWVQNGPKGARYNRSKSGWFDTSCFEDWFHSLVLPHLRKIPGKKAIIGDNLSSHISLQVLQQCEAENITFICLPANSTHLTQPLDVAYFRPMKIAWRQILCEFKSQNSNISLIPKSIFPFLLKKLMETVDVRGGKNLESGFRKCGIFPLDKEQVLQKIPNYKMNENNAAEVSASVSDAVLNFLAEKRGIKTGETSAIKRRKKINVVLGKSICAEDLLAQTAEAEISKAAKITKEKTKNETKVKSSEKKQNIKNNTTKKNVVKKKESSKSVPVRQSSIDFEIENNLDLEGKNRNEEIVKTIIEQPSVEANVTPSCSGKQKKNSKLDRDNKKKKCFYDLSDTSASDSSVEYMDESDSEEFPAPVSGDYVIVTDNLVCFPGKFDGYSDDQRYGWVIGMIQDQDNYSKWPQERIRQCYHMIDIDVAPEPTKIEENQFFFPTL